MTFPVGRLPNSGEVQDHGKTVTPYKSLAFTHGGSDLDLTAPANKLLPCATEFYCTLTGNLVAQLAGDASPQTYPVTAGQVVRGLFVLIKSTSTADGLCRQ